MKILAYSSEGDPLFVRDGTSHFEVEERWVTDARNRKWAPDSQTQWDKVWSDTFEAHRPESDLGVRIYRPGTTPALPDGPVLVKPAIRILVANYLPDLEERNAEELRARTIERLGGNAPDDDVRVRREEAHDAEWARKHPKARPSHPSVPLCTGKIMPFSFKLPSFFEVSPSPKQFTNITTSVIRLETLDDAQARRQKAMDRLKEPDPEDTIERDVRYLLDGLRRRHVL